MFIVLFWFFLFLGNFVLFAVTLHCHRPLLTYPPPLPLCSLQVICGSWLMAQIQTNPEFYQDCIDSLKSITEVTQQQQRKQRVSQRQDYDWSGKSRRMCITNMKPVNQIDQHQVNILSKNNSIMHCTEGSTYWQFLWFSHPHSLCCCYYCCGTPNWIRAFVTIRS